MSGNVVQVDLFERKRFDNRMRLLDFTNIKLRLIGHAKMSVPLYEVVEDLYKKTLFIHHIKPDIEIVLPRDIDNFWQTHITDTRQYAEDCHVLFDGFFHRTPPELMDLETYRSDIQNTRDAIFNEFSIDILSADLLEKKKDDAAQPDDAATGISRWLDGRGNLLPDK